MSDLATRHPAQPGGGLKGSSQVSARKLAAEIRLIASTGRKLCVVRQCFGIGLSTRTSALRMNHAGQRDRIAGAYLYILAAEVELVEELRVSGRDGRAQSG